MGPKGIETSSHSTSMLFRWNCVIGPWLSGMCRAQESKQCSQSKSLIQTDERKAHCESQKAVLLLDVETFKSTMIYLKVPHKENTPSQQGKGDFCFTCSLV